MVKCVYKYVDFTTDRWPKALRYREDELTFSGLIHSKPAHTLTFIVIFILIFPTEPYLTQLAHLPTSGKHIVAHYDDQGIVVYQAFNPQIAADAVRLQHFGGSHYSFNRMSWIKPNFLWMMYRAGWATKPNQERILAITMSQDGFRTILAQAVHSSYQSHLYDSREAWKAQLAASDVRLQWDPDHDPHGVKQERRAIQLGLKGNTLKRFSEEWIHSIKDITDFVAAQKAKLDGEGIETLEVPVERVW